MSTKLKIFIASALVAVGLIIFALVMSALGWDFTKLNTSKYETNTHEITESFDDISINTDTADIRFLPAQDGKCKVVCYEMEKVRHEVTVTEGILTVEAVDTRAWYDYIGISFSTQTVTVYLPAGMYEALLIRSDTGHVELPNDFSFGELDIEVSTGDVNFNASVTGAVKIKASTGDVTVKGVTAGALDLSTSTGGVTVSEATVLGDIKVSTSTGSTSISDTECGSLTSTASTGGIYLSSTVASGSFSLEVGTGSIHFNACDATEIYARAGTGSVTGTLLSEKVFIATSSTGTVDVPRGTSGGVCEITTGTGDIRLSID